MVVKVFVYGIRGEKLPIDLCENEEQLKTITVQQLKEKIVTLIPDLGDVVEDNKLRLIFVDKVLDDDSSFLSEYGIIDESVLHIFLKIPGGGGPLPPRGDVGMCDKDDKHRDQQRLSFNGQQMEDGRTLSYYGITDGSTVHQLLPEEDDGMGHKMRLMEQHCVQAQMDCMRELVEVHERYREMACGSRECELSLIRTEEFDMIRVPEEDDGMGDKTGKNRSMEVLLKF